MHNPNPFQLLQESNDNMDIPSPADADVNQSVLATTTIHLQGEAAAAVIRDTAKKQVAQLAVESQRHAAAAYEAYRAAPILVATIVASEAALLARCTELMRKGYVYESEKTLLQSQQHQLITQSGHLCSELAQLRSAEKSAFDSESARLILLETEVNATHAALLESNDVTA